MNFSERIIVTKDGSHTVKAEHNGQLYHSIHGAVTESNHVFIENGLNWYINQHPNKKELKIIETGFGTGLNALLTYLWGIQKNIQI